MPPYRQHLISCIPHSPATVLYQLREGAINEKRAAMLISNMVMGHANGQVIQGQQAERSISQVESRLDKSSLRHIHIRYDNHPRGIEPIQLYARAALVRVSCRNGSFNHLVNDGSPSALRIGRLTGRLP